MAIKDYYPSIRPSLDLNFAASRTVDPRISFTRGGTGSVASYFDKNGVMKFAPPNLPRIDFNPVTGESKGLLVEEQRTNLLLYSNQFSNAMWGTISATISQDVTASPDSSVNADKLIEGAATSEHYIGQFASVTTGTTYVFSTFAKAGERTLLRLRTAVNFPDAGTVFDLITGTVSVNQHGIGMAGIEAVGNGWFRCWVIATATSTGTTVARIQIFNTDVSYLGDGSSGLYIFGSQLEAGTCVSSYIPTEAAQVTRASDVAYMTGGAFQWYKQGNSCIVADASGAKLKLIACLDDGTDSNRIQISIGSNAAFEVYSVVSGAVTNAFSGATTPASESERARISAALKTGSSQVSINGQLPFGSSPYTGDIPSSLTHLRIGSNWNGGGQISGHIRRIAVYPSVFQNAIYQSLSA